MWGNEFGGCVVKLPAPSQSGSGRGMLHSSILTLGAGRKCLLNGSGEPSRAFNLPSAWKSGAGKTSDLRASLRPSWSQRRS
jgi:hypothetical protein